MKEPGISYIKRIIFIDQVLWFGRIKNTVSKMMQLFVCKSLIDFNEAFTPYNEKQFFDWPSIVAHSSAWLMCIAYGLVILVHRNRSLPKRLITFSYRTLQKDISFSLEFRMVQPKLILISIYLFTASFVCTSRCATYSHKH